VPAFADAIVAWEQERGPDDEVRKARELLSLYAAYEEENRKRETVDFSDLILLPLIILRSNGAVRSAYRERYRWVLVDEYQDVGRSVAELFAQL
jgi:superfamily I DNA/RNA helicase